MAAKQLDEMWDGQVAILNGSFAATIALLDQGKGKEAADEFHANFAQAVKKIYSEAASTYPQRFAKIDDWCSWVKNLYITSAKADKALAAGSVDESRKLLVSMRESFYKLHKETDTQTAGDVVYAIYAESQKDQPEAGVIKDLNGKLGEIKPSSNVKVADLTQARSSFDGKVTPLLADNKVEAGELPVLRTAAGDLYKACGMQFE